MEQRRLPGQRLLLGPGEQRRLGAKQPGEEDQQQGELNTQWGQRSHHRQPIFSFFSVSSGEALLWFLQAPLKAAGDSWMSPINRQFSNMGILVRLKTNDPITVQSKSLHTDGPSSQAELQTLMCQDFM